MGLRETAGKGLVVLGVFGFVIMAVDVDSGCRNGYGCCYDTTIMCRGFCLVFFCISWLFSLISHPFISAPAEGLPPSFPSMPTHGATMSFSASKSSPMSLSISAFEDLRVLAGGEGGGGDDERTEDVFVVRCCREDVGKSISLKVWDEGRASRLECQGLSLLWARVALVGKGARAKSRMIGLGG